MFLYAYVIQRCITTNRLLVKLTLGNCTNVNGNILFSVCFLVDHVEDPKPSSLSTGKQVVLLIVGVILICGCVFIGGLIYSKQQEQQRKRFY